MMGLLRTPVLTPRRIWLAFTIAVAADAIQLTLGPVGWLFADELIDIATMALLSVVVGFHPLFIPTFVAEFVPMVDMLPTWTGCITVVVALRHRQQQRTGPTPTVTSAPPPPSGSKRDEVIDV
jgi:hypothetical protein